MLEEECKILCSTSRQLIVTLVLKLLDSFNYFCISQIIILFLHTEYQVSDLNAGLYYGIWGALITLYALLTSCLNDILGTRKSLLIGFTLECIASFTLALTYNKYIMFFVLFFLLPLSNSMGIPMLTTYIKRLTTKQNRGFYYSIFYSVMNIGALLAGPTIDLFDIFCSNHGESSATLSANRLVIFTTGISALSAVFVTYFFINNTNVDEDTGEIISINDAIIVSDSKLETEKSVVSHRQSVESARLIIKDILGNPTFWRFNWFVLILINLKSIFRHLDATLPTYLIREFSPTFPRGSIYSINPFIIIFLSPLMGIVCAKYKHYDMIKIGGYISAISPFFLAMSTSLWGVILFVVMLSLGEAIWSPRTYDYGMSIAPRGKEATFSALATAPLFVAKIPVGLLSGYLVSTYLDENDTSNKKENGQIMWLIIGLMTLTSPIALSVFERCIREPETFTDNPENVSLSMATIDDMEMEDSAESLNNIELTQMGGHSKGEDVKFVELSQEDSDAAELSYNPMQIL
jgi:MFS family permease